ncbi:unnamed protein product [Adineta ricciae]|uniref:Uncharacterized protein n=1 Tax=Adineta ricciae TaxID=249248 RepID=A0A815NMW2_ADIRI|nr:unnamed protein product [Adineta ricciae]
MSPYILKISIILDSTGFLTSASTVSMETAKIQMCNVLECRSIVLHYFSKNWVFKSDQLGECKYCPYLDNDVMSTDWLYRWYEGDFFIENSIGQRWKGNLRICIKECFKNAECVGFTRSKHISPYDRDGECWFKNNVMTNRINNHSDWLTVVFNTTSYEVH